MRNTQSILLILALMWFVAMVVIGAWLELRSVGQGAWAKPAQPFTYFLLGALSTMGMLILFANS